MGDLASICLLSLPPPNDSQMSSKWSPNEFQMTLLNDPQMSANDSKWFIWLQMIPDDSKWLQMTPDDSRWLQMIPDDSRWLHMTPDDSRWFHMTPNDPRHWFLFHDSSNWFTKKLCLGNKYIGILKQFQGRRFCPPKCTCGRWEDLVKIVRMDRPEN